MSNVDPMVGRVLDGRYRVGPRIARGGMATVYEAHDLRLDRGCAVKVMHSDLGDDHDFASRFVREAHSAARLSHPNVVSVTDQGDDDGVLFLVMEHIVGRTLRDVIREEAPMPPARALDLVEPVLLALAEAHRCGIVHRDVKPENVLIADDGRVKVADFGLARAFNSATQHTRTQGVLIGTVSYLAPELIVDGKADPRSDVYAAGVLLYEMLTGRKPHEGEGAIQIAYKHVNEDIPAPSDALDEPLPAYVDALVARATSRDRERRQADAKVFLHQLRRVRAALESGEGDDPELTADLLPTVPLLLDDGIDYVEENPSAHFAGPHHDEERTSVIAAGAGVLAPSSTSTLVDQLPVDVPRGPAVPVSRAGAPARPLGSPPGASPRPPAGASAPRRPRRSRRGPVLLLLVVVLTALAAYGGWWLGIGRYTTMPGVINMSVTDATAKVEAAGLELDVVEEQFSETVSAGAVISSDPEGGARVLEGDTVEVVVSLGKERYEVPRLRGRPLARARELLERSNLVEGDVTRVFHEEIDKGVVIAASPPSGTELKRGEAVDLTVSKGPEPIKIPDFTGRDGDRAQQVLTERGFEVAVTEENHDSVPEGRVISQSPDEGTGFRGDEISLVVSKGPVMVEVPDLQAKSVGEATSLLEAAGLRAEIVETQFYIGLDRVARQSPGGGDMVRKGAVVTLYVI